MGNTKSQFKEKFELVKNATQSMASDVRDDVMREYNRMRYEDDTKTLSQLTENKHDMDILIGVAGDIKLRQHPYVYYQLFSKINDEQLLRKLIPIMKNYVDINVQHDGDGMTALMHMIKLSPLHLQCMLDNGSDATIEDRYGNTALHFACKLTDPEDATEKIKILMDAGCSINKRNIFYKSPLSYLSQNYCDKLTELKDKELNLIPDLIYNPPVSNQSENVNGEEVEIVDN